MLSDEQMSKRWPFSLLNDEQMSNWVGVKHLPAIVGGHQQHLYNHPKRAQAQGCQVWNGKDISWLFYKVADLSPIHFRKPSATDGT